MQARPVGSCREAVCRLQTGCRGALGTPMLPIPGEKSIATERKKKEKTALMGTRSRDAGKYVKRKGRGRVQKKHSIKERERERVGTRASKSWEYFCHMDEQISTGKAVIK